MNYSVETSVVETQTTELQALVGKQTQDAIVELNSLQLMLVGGGATIVLE
jgi:hypothetical protein